jgi:competence protein ComEC
MPLLTLLALAWCAGLWIALRLNQPVWAWLAFCALALVCLVLLREKPRLRAALTMAFALGLGAARAQAARPPLGDPGFIATYTDRGSVVVEGVIATEPAVGEGPVELRVKVERLWLASGTDPLPVHGLILVHTARDSASRLAAVGQAGYRYGDRVRVTGTLEAPPNFEGFAYRDYLAHQGVYALVRQARVSFVAARAGSPAWQALSDFKVHALKTLAKLFPEPHASLLAGILLGDDGGLPASLADAFARTNTAHIIAISGFNVAILVGALLPFARRLWGPTRGVAAVMLVVVAYTLLAGAGASVVRAAIMGSLALVASRLGRRVVGLNTLAAAAIFMTLINPAALYDVGFQLSAAATLGLILYGDRFQARVEQAAARYTTALRAARLAAAAGELFLITGAVQLTTLPLLIFNFRQFSLVTLLANSVILPVQPALMIVSGAALLLGLVWLPLGQVVAWLAWPFSAYTIAFVQFFARLPYAAFALGDTAVVLVAAYYISLFGLSWLLSRPQQQRPAWWEPARQRLPAGGLLLMASLTLLAWSWYFSAPAPDGRLRVTLLDIGSPLDPAGGEALLIQTPSGGMVLIDGGPGALTLANRLAGQLPLFKRDLDLLVVAAPDNENIGGLPDLLDRYRVRQALMTRATNRSGAYAALREKLIAQKIATIDAGSLPALDLGDGVSLSVLADRAEGSVLRLSWRRFSLVVAPGLDAAGEAELLSQGLAPPATALLLAGGGTNNASSEAWLQALNPRVALISVDAGNLSGDPSPDVLARLAGRAVLRTDQRGNITLSTDGEQLWVEAER